AAQMRAPKAPATKILQLIRPVDNASRKLHKQAFANAEHEILAALALPHPLMILLPADAPLSANLRRVLPRAIPLAPIDREIHLALLAQTHSGTDRTQVAPLLPSDAALANLDTPSLLARAIAASANVPLIESAFGVWQSAGHLGDMLREMRASFSEAIRQKPSVLFIDEIDAVGSREGDDRHGAAYRRNVITQFLAEIDRLNREEGVVMIGATNHPQSLDPAIRRPGRFDRHCVLGRPLQAQIQHMLRRALPADSAVDLAALARAFTGETPALIDAQIRAAKSAARRAGTPFNAAHILAQLPVSQPERDSLERRIAIHECGHAVAAALLGAGPVHRIQLLHDGGATHRAPAIREGSAAEFTDELTIILAGRAAERLILGTISAGAGGCKDSDLAMATRLQLRFDREAGLGVNGNAWLGPVDLARLSSSDTDRLRLRLDRVERRARRLLDPHRDLLQRLANHLLRERELDEQDLAPWLSDLSPNMPTDAPTWSWYSGGAAPQSR
ncbi:AAA family ATPase, partial [Salipiger sp. 1_MG-2023]|uniref:AAA family ATPase n=1 Tax=Salipiger sp. 1_MG-2023 TaxID=3062665 RepID=UPI0026E3901E